MINFKLMAQSIRVLERRVEQIQPRSSSLPAVNASDVKTPRAQVIEPTHSIPEDATAEVANADPDVDVDAMIASMREQQNAYDYTKANSASINTYDKKDSKLVDQVLLTRKAMYLSGITVGNKSHGYELTPSTLLDPKKLVTETDSLKSQLSNQLGFLGVNRSANFSLSQNDNGDIVVSGDDSKSSDAIATTLNSSEHFKETFNLLKTAENALNFTGNGDNFATRAYSLNASPDSMVGNVKVLEKGPNVGYASDLAQVSDTEIYLLARLGTSAYASEYTVAC